MKDWNPDIRAGGVEPYLFDIRIGMQEMEDEITELQERLVKVLAEQAITEATMQQPIHDPVTHVGPDNSNSRIFSRGNPCSVRRSGFWQ